MKVDNLLSTLKGEYARTLILILIPGAIALEPIAIIFYKIYSFKISGFSDNIIFFVALYVLGSVLFGFIIQDIGSRIEIKLDKYYCKRHKLDIDAFYDTFELYLFNKKEEDYIVTHYYRSILVRLRFELHTCAAIILLWLGSFLRRLLLDDFQLNWSKTIPFAILSVVLFIYLLYEAKEGVKLLHKLRVRINQKFRPII